MQKLRWPEPRRARNVPADFGARPTFLGENFSRATRLWSNGYVLYSPSGPVIAVRYEGDKGNGLSDWVTNDKEAEAVEERLRTLLRVLHSNQSVEKPRNLSGELAKFKAEPFCSSQLDQYCGPRLVVLGRQWDACL